MAPAQKQASNLPQPAPRSMLHDHPDTSPAPSDLGPITEARFAAAFARGALITKQAAAELLGLDPGTVDLLTLHGVIVAVPRGRRRGYAEHELRRYLTEMRPRRACREALTC